MKIFLTLFSALALSLNSYAQNLNTFHDYSGETILGDSIDFSMFYGKKVLVVNTASYCSYTHQYADLEELYLNYNQYDFEIIGFPCNDFLNQEPGDDSTINDFCQTYNITFQMMSKVATVAADTAPVYKWLQRQDLNGVQDAPVTWNFNKFLIDEAGHWVRHFNQQTDPLDTAITNWIMRPSVLLGIGNENEIAQHAVFPNPTEELVNITYRLTRPETVTITLTDLTGKLMFSTIEEKPEGLNKTILNCEVNQITSGVYSLKVETSSKSFTHKLVLVK